MEEPPKPTAEEQIWNSKTDIIKHFSGIHSSISKDIKDDFVLGKPTQQEKKFVIKMAGLANFSRNIYQKIHDNTLAMTDNPLITDEYRLRLIEEARIIKTVKDQVFYNHMIKATMIVIMARNDETNFLLKVAAGVDLNQQEQQEEPQEKEQMKSLLERIKPKPKGEEQ